MNTKLLTGRAKPGPSAAECCRDRVLPLCSAHAGRNAGAGAPPGNQNRRTHGFCASALQPEELADLVAFSGDMTLNDEIVIARVTLRRILAQLSVYGQPHVAAPVMAPEDYARLAALSLAGAPNRQSLTCTRFYARIRLEEGASWLHCWSRTQICWSPWTMPVVAS